MAGVIRGSVDHLIGNTGSAQNNYQEYFVTVYNFLNTHWTRIASYYGSASGGLDAGGFNYWDAGSGHAGEQAFAVFRTNGNALPAYNVVLSWSSLTWSNWSITNFTSVDAVGIGPALLNTGADAWNGTKNNTGADTLGSPRWSIGAASTLFTFNWYNESGGARATNKEDLLRVNGDLASSTSQALLHMWMDDDNFMVWQDGQSGNLDATYSSLFFGKYNPISSNNSLPVIGLDDNNFTGAWLTGGGSGAIYGSTNQEGGALLPTTGSGFTYHFDSCFENSTYSQSLQLDGYSISSPLALVHRSTQGHLGFMDSNFIKHSTNQPINSVGTNENGNKVAFLGNSTTTRRAIVPWHSAGPPGANMSRTGYQFSITL